MNHAVKIVLFNWSKKKEMPTERKMPRLLLFCSEAPLGTYKQTHEESE